MNKAKYLGIALAATLTACSTNDFDSVPAVNGNGMITAYAPQGNGNVATRTAYEADGSNLNVKWNASGEDMYTINAYTDGWTAGQLKQVSASEDGSSANFNAYDIDATKQVGYKSGKLFAFYPQNETVANNFKSLSADGTTVSVPLTLGGQSGKLADLHNYDYMTATSSVSADNNVGDLQMKHEIAVLHINKGIKTLVENGTISKVVVSATGMKSAGTMTITRNGSDITSSVAGTGSDASIAINNCSYTVSNNQLADDIYLAILPGTMTNLTMKLTIDGNDFDYIYQGTTTNFEAGKIYNWSPTVDPGVMYFTIKTTASLKDFTIPFATTGTCPAQIVVNWGDGSSTTVNEGQSLSATTFKHSYSSNNTTYRITVNSAQKDVTKKQIPEFNFGKYPTDYTSSLTSSNVNGALLKSMDSPLLNSGINTLSTIYFGAENLERLADNVFANYPNVTTFANAFRNCKSLKGISKDIFAQNAATTSFNYTFRGCSSLNAIPTGLFDQNIAVTSFVGTFRDCSSLTTIPKGLFDKNISVTTFDWLFCGCTSLETAPAGLFAYNAKATVFSSVFQQCYMLKLTDDIFITDAITKATRFASAPDKVDFSNAFYATGKNRGSDKGTAPDLWNYTYAKGCGFYDNYTVFFTGTSGKEPTYYTNTIPTAWYETYNKSGFCYLKSN